MYLKIPFPLFWAGWNAFWLWFETTGLMHRFLIVDHLTASINLSLWEKSLLSPKSREVNAPYGLNHSSVFTFCVRKAGGTLSTLVQILLLFRIPDNCDMRGGFPWETAWALPQPLSNEEGKRCHRWQSGFSSSLPEAESSQGHWPCVCHVFFMFPPKKPGKLNEASHGAHVCFPLSAWSLSLWVQRHAPVWAEGRAQLTCSSTGKGNKRWSQAGKPWQYKVITWLLRITFLLLHIIYGSHRAINVRPSSMWDKPAVLHSSPVTRGNTACEFRQGGDLRNLLCYMHRLWDIAHLLLCAWFGDIWWKGCLNGVGSLACIVSGLREGWVAAEEPVTPLGHSGASGLPAVAICGVCSLGPGFGSPPEFRPRVGAMVSRQFLTPDISHAGSNKCLYWSGTCHCSHARAGAAVAVMTVHFISVIFQWKSSIFQRNTRTALLASISEYTCNLTRREEKL